MLGRSRWWGIGVVLACWGSMPIGYAQVDSVAPELYQEEVAPVELKKKYFAKNYFYGLKVRKARIVYGRGKRRITEVFYHLKPKHEPQTPSHSPYVYWHDIGEKKIRYTRTYDPADGLLLHGRYERWLGKQLLEERYFYHGVRHSRWKRLSKNNILISKSHYFEGWSRDGIKRYYDVEQTKLRDVIPIQGAYKRGFYYAFHPNGEIAVVGEYLVDKKVGIWKEFYDNGNRKRNINYGDYVFYDAFVPYIEAEWNPRGNTLYSYEVDEQVSAIFN